MHVVSKKPFVEAARAHTNQARTLIDVYVALRKLRFTSPEQMRQVFPSLDNFKYEDRWWVIDVGGNHLRIVFYIDFVRQRVFVKAILTHTQYERFTARFLRKNK